MERCSSYLISDFKPFQQGDELLLDVGLLRRKKIEQESQREMLIFLLYGVERNDRSKTKHFQ